MSQWLAIRFDLLGSIISVFIALIAFLTQSYQFIPASFDLFLSNDQFIEICGTYGCYIGSTNEQCRAATVLY
jgi:hypothetical protein